MKHKCSVCGAPARTRLCVIESWEKIADQYLCSKHCTEKIMGPPI